MSNAPFDGVVTAHGDRVWRVCRALLPHADAEDAWSETFLAALQSYEKLDAGRIGGWLVTVAHRKSIDILRRSSKFVPGEPTEGWRVDAARDLDLAHALARLPERQRQTVVLHHLGGLPFAEVAARLECSVPAARKASSDGVQRLRIEMGAASLADADSRSSAAVVTTAKPGGGGEA